MKVDFEFSPKEIAMEVLAHYGDGQQQQTWLLPPRRQILERVADLVSVGR